MTSCDFDNNRDGEFQMVPLSRHFFNVLRSVRLIELACMFYDDVPYLSLSLGNIIPGLL